MPRIWDIHKNWLTYLEHNRGYSKKTIEAYGSDLTLFFSFLEKYHSQDISLEIIKITDQTAMRSFVADLSKNKYAATSRSRIISAIKNYIKYLKQNNYLSEDYTLSINNPKLAKALPKALSENETNNLLESFKQEQHDWPDVRDLTIFLLLYTAGLRISEALNLKREDIFDNYLRITGKGNKERIVPLIKVAAEYLKLYLEEIPHPIKTNSPIFLGVKGGPLNPRIVQKKIAYYRNILNLPENTTPHSLRHSYATHLLDGGANLREIQELLGHKNLATTERYTKITNAKLIDIYQKSHNRE